MAPAAPHDGSNCPDITHIKDRLNNMSDQVDRLTDLVERLVRLEEQSANHGAAVGRAFGEIETIDNRLAKLEERSTYLRGGVKYLTIAAACVLGVLSWGLKAQVDIVQQLPVRLDRIERQQTEEIKIDERLTAEIERLKDASHAAR